MPDQPAPSPDRDELAEEVRAYRDCFKDCSATEILELMGQMHEFFFGRMSPEDFQRYEAVRAALDEPPDGGKR